MVLVVRLIELLSPPEPPSYNPLYLRMLRRAYGSYERTYEEM